MLVRFSLAVAKERFGVAAFAPIVYFLGKPWADFDSAGLALLASDRQCYPVSSVYRNPYPSWSRTMLPMKTSSRNRSSACRDNSSGWATTFFLWQRGYSFFLSSLLTPISFKNIAT